MQRTIFPIWSLAILAACGGGGGAVTEEPFTGQVIATPLAPAISSDFVTNTRTLQARTGVSPKRQLFRETTTTYIIDDFDTFTRLIDGERTIMFEALGDHTVAQVFGGTELIGGNNEPFRGFRIENEDGSTPVSGSATYEGDYAGLLTTLVENLKTESYISGDVEIDVDFAAATANGIITNRTRYLTATGAPAPSNFEDLALNELAIADGAYVTPGSTGGGKLTNGDAIPANSSGTLSGAWGLLFGGPGATEVVGFVQISHDYLQTNGGIGDDYQETGVFSARD